MNSAACHNRVCVATVPIPDLGDAWRYSIDFCGLGSMNQRAFADATIPEDSAVAPEFPCAGLYIRVHHTFAHERSESDAVTPPLSVVSYNPAHCCAAARRSEGVRRSQDSIDC